MGTRLKSDQRGIIAIEMLIAFFGFLLCMVFMLMWIHIVSVQTRVHYALTQTAQELSFYAQALEIFGVSHVLREMNDRAEPTRREINATVNDVFGAWDAVQGMGANTNFGSITDAVNSIQVIGEGADATVTHLQSAGDQITDWADNPEDFFRGLMWVAGSEAAHTGINALFGHAFIPSFFWRYMQLGNETGQTYMHRNFTHGTTGGDQAVAFTWWDWNPSLGTNMGLQGPSLFTGHPYSDEMTISVRYNLRLGEQLRRWQRTEAQAQEAVREGRRPPLTETILNSLTVTQQVQARAWTGDGEWFRFRNDAPQNFAIRARRGRSDRDY